MKKCNVESEIDLALEKQSKAFYAVRGKLKTNIPIDDRIEILQANEQFIPKKNSEVRHPAFLLHYSLTQIIRISYTDLGSSNGRYLLWSYATVFGMQGWKVYVQKFDLLLHWKHFRMVRVFQYC